VKECRRVPVPLLVSVSTVVESGLRHQQSNIPTCCAFRVYTNLSQWCRHSPPSVVSTQSAYGVDTVHLCVDNSSLSQKPVLKQ
ncbi:hypothetical protein Taro_048770, partial [Colocasia esculenta]|nr:hypothetical protein [Colocasia esculenta]